MATEPKTAKQIFELLVGTWKNMLDCEWMPELGWNFIIQPRPTPYKPTDAKFMIRYMQMLETLEISSLKDPDPLRNVGLTGEAGSWLAKYYETYIEDANKEVEDGKHEFLHQEVGHFLMNVTNKEGDTKKDDKAPIIRQATVSPTNTTLTTGKIKRGEIKDAKDIYDARPHAISGFIPSFIDPEKINKEFEKTKDEIDRKGGPDFTKSLKWLRERYQDRVAGGFEDWVFHFGNKWPSPEMVSGQRVADTVHTCNLRSDFWISQREIKGSPQTLLQYAQVIDLEFHGFKWPHVVVNTLIKQPEEVECQVPERRPPSRLIPPIPPSPPVPPIR